MTITPSLLFAAILAAAPLSGALLHAAAVPQDDAVAEPMPLDARRISMEYRRQGNAIYERMMDESGGEISFEAFAAAMLEVREAICNEHRLDADALSLSEIQMLFEVLTPALQARAVERIERVAGVADITGFEAAMMLASMQPSAERVAAMLDHPGVREYVGRNGMVALMRPLRSVGSDSLAEAAPQLLALGELFTPTVAGTQAVATYMKMVVDLGDAVDPETREALRLRLVEISRGALAAAEAEESARDADRLRNAIARLESAAMRGMLIGHPAPEIAFEWYHDGQSPQQIAGLDAFKGKIVVLDFWATWCGPCIASFPQVRELRALYPEEDLVILGVTSIQGRHHPWRQPAIDCSGDPDKERSLMVGYMGDMEMTWPVAFSTQPVFNPDYDVNGIPHLAIIDAEGVLRHNGLHPAMPMERKRALLDPLLVAAGKTPPGE